MIEPFIDSVSGKRIGISIAGNVMRPSPYSQFLADHIPNLLGQRVADIGSGTGVLSIVAKLRGADEVYMIDINPVALELSMKSAQQNGIETGMIPLQSDILSRVSPDIHFDTIICNPASLPMSQSDQPNSPYYAGPYGRHMIEGLIYQAPRYLHPGSSLLMVHTTLADYPKSEQLMKNNRFEPVVVDRLRLEFRPFYDRAWIDGIGGLSRGLYVIEHGRPYEIINMVVAKYVGP